MSSAEPQTFWLQIGWLFILGLPIACVSWTVTHEEIFREGREYCQARSQSCRRLFARKFFYIATCEYCFSHYVTLGFMAMTGYRLLLDDWRGSVIAFFALVGMANVYLSAYGRLRVDIKAERLQIAATERQIEALPDPDRDQGGRANLRRVGDARS